LQAYKKELTCLIGGKGKTEMLLGEPGAKLAGTAYF
jgi:hypothetical protein